MHKIEKSATGVVITFSISSGTTKSLVERVMEDPSMVRDEVKEELFISLLKDFRKVIDIYIDRSREE